MILWVYQIPKKGSAIERPTTMQVQMKWVNINLMFENGSIDPDLWRMTQHCKASMRLMLFLNFGNEIRKGAHVCFRDKYSHHLQVCSCSFKLYTLKLFMTLWLKFINGPDMIIMFKCPLLPLACFNRCSKTKIFKKKEHFPVTLKLSIKTLTFDCNATGCANVSSLRKSEHNPDIW